MMKRRMPSLLLALSLLLTVGAAADNDDAGESVSWELDGEVLTLEGSGETYDFELGGAPWSAERQGVERAVVREGVTVLGENVFSGCGGLRSAELPVSLRGISDSAFADCPALESIYYAGSLRQWRENVSFSGGVGKDNGLRSARLYFADPSDPFSDVQGWYHDSVVSCYALGIVNGHTDGSFKPNDEVTRAQFVAMLYNLCGCPRSSCDLHFSDADQIAGCYAAAVRFGVSTGVIAGYEDNTFRPNEEISRAQMAAFACRLMDALMGGIDPQLKRENVRFSDSTRVLPCYREAVSVMANLGIINGYPDGSFGPDNTATRAESATVLLKMYDVLSQID